MFDPNKWTGPIWSSLWLLNRQTNQYRFIGWAYEPGMSTSLFAEIFRRSNSIIMSYPYGEGGPPNQETI